MDTFNVPKDEDIQQVALEALPKLQLRIRNELAIAVSDSRQGGPDHTAFMNDCRRALAAINQRLAGALLN